MNCPECGAEVRLKSQFCTGCGARFAVSQTDIAQAASSDAAQRRGKILSDYAHGGAWVAGAVLVLSCGVVYLFDKPLVFSAAALPTLPAHATAMNTAGPTGALIAPFVEPRPLPPLKEIPERRLGYRTALLKSALRAKAITVSMSDGNNAINRGLKFLFAEQQPNGSWPVHIIPKAYGAGETADYQWGATGVSALALLTFFGEGHTWLPDDVLGHSTYTGTVTSGMKYLLSMQDPATGRFGSGEGERVHFMYNHGMATLALAEATALSGDADLRAQLAPAVAYIVKTQTQNGGWNYYGHAEGDDVSVSVWQVQALAAAREAGVAVPDETFERAARMFKKATVGDRVMYRLQNDDNIFTPSLAGMGLMMRQLLGESASSPDVHALATRLSNQKLLVKTDWQYANGFNPTRKDALERARVDPYEFYFCTCGMYYSGGPEWAAWQQNCMKNIFTLQEPDGSFRCTDVNTQKGGVVYSTALILMALQCPYRFDHSVRKGE